MENSSYNTCITESLSRLKIVSAFMYVAQIFTPLALQTFF